MFSYLFDIRYTYTLFVLFYFISFYLYESLPLTKSEHWRLDFDAKISTVCPITNCDWAKMDHVIYSRQSQLLLAKTDEYRTVALHIASVYCGFFSIELSLIFSVLEFRNLPKLKIYRKYILAKYIFRNLPMIINLFNQA